MPTFDAGTSGLVGTVGVTILDDAGAVHVARTTAGITEPVAGSGIYAVADHDPAATLTYVWDNGVGTVGASETLYAGRGDDAAILAVMAKTANLPASPAAVGSAMTLTSPYDHAKDDVLTPLGDVLLKTNTIGSLAVTVTSPVAASGTITVYTGDDYASADSRAITVTVADLTHALGLDGAVVTLKATQATWEAASVVSTTDGYTVTFEATAAQTAAVTRAQHYELEATLANGHVVTLAKGSLLTRTNIPAVV